MAHVSQAEAAHRWHDLMNLLTAIKGRAQATRHRIQRTERLDPAAVAADLAQIEARADRMAAMLFAIDAAAREELKESRSGRDAAPPPSTDQSRGRPVGRR